MPLTIEQLRDEIVALPAEARESLLLSVQGLGKNPPPDLHPDWEEELRYRMAEHHAGRMDSISLEEFQRALEDQAQARINAR